MTFYNDNDPKCVAWLRELVRADLVTPGTVNEQSIHTLDPSTLSAYDRVHLFAGIGGWDYALQLANWSADRPVWTGSCPCQPFSCAGDRQGERDPRHLWPEFLRLVTLCHPPTIFGEQVASRAGREWLARVRADLEALGYAIGSTDLCAASQGAPHIRQRLFWVAASQHPNWRTEQPINKDASRRDGLGWSGDPGWLANDSGPRLEVLRLQQAREECATVKRGVEAGGMDNPSSPRPLPPEREPESDPRNNPRLRGPEPGREPGGMANPIGGRCFGGPSLSGWRPEGRVVAVRTGEIGNPWAASVPVWCRDNKWRRVPATAQGTPEPVLFPLAYGLFPARVGILRGAGNAIVPQVAATFIRAFLGAERELMSENHP